MAGSKSKRPLDPLKAWLLQRGDVMMHRIYGPRKRSIYGELPSAIVEIGPGAGANMRYYPPHTRLIAIEPNPAMQPHLKKQAERYGIELHIKPIRGERIDLPDNSVAAVIGTLVLCSVDDPCQVVSEIRRILVPGGRFIFLEHVADIRGTHLRRLQKYLCRGWSWLSAGCHLNRETHEIINRAGFACVDMDCFTLKSHLLPFSPHIFGVAVN
jgi:SAM-dependent methyltransferase